MNKHSVKSVAQVIGFIALGLLAALLLLGCVSTAAVKSGGAAVYDAVLDTAIYTKCKAASIGSIDRRYMQTHEGWELWYRECRGASDLRLPMPPPMSVGIDPDG